MEKQIPNSFETIVIDADYLAYICSFPTQSNRFFVRDKEGNGIVDKPLLSSCERHLKKIGIPVEDCIITQEPVEHKNWQFIVKKIADKKINEWRDGVGASKVILAFGSATNFRDRLPLFDKYKGNRDPAKKPILLKEIKEFLKASYHCEMPFDAEADDVISMYQFKRK